MGSSGGDKLIRAWHWSQHLVSDGMTIYAYYCSVSGSARCAIPGTVQATYGECSGVWCQSACRQMAPVSLAGWDGGRQREG